MDGSWSEDSTPIPFCVLLWCRDGRGVRPSGSYQLFLNVLDMLDVLDAVMLDAICGRLRRGDRIEGQ